MDGPQVGDPPRSARVASNGLWNLLANVLPSLVVTTASVVMARRLGPQEFGVYVFAVFVYGAASQVAVWGLPATTTRFVAVARAQGRPHVERAVAEVVLRTGLCGAGVTAAAIAIVGGLRGGDTGRALVLAAGVTLALAPVMVLVSVLTGQERFRDLALWQLATGFANPLLTILVVLAGAGVVAVLAVDILASALGGLALLILLWRRMPVRLVGRKDLPPGFWAFAKEQAVLVLLGVIVFQRSEVLFLEWLSDRGDVAMYGVAFGLSQIVWRLGGPLLAAVGPALARILSEGVSPETTPAVQRALEFAILIGFGGSALGIVIAPDAIEVLYGARYADAALPAQILLAFSWAVIVGAAVAGVASGLAEQAILISTGVVGAIINISFNLVLVRAHGAAGAAVANAAAQTFVAIALFIWLHRRAPSLHMGGLPRVLVPGLVAATLAVPLAGFLPPLQSLLATALVSGTAFLLSAHRLGVLDEDVAVLLQRGRRALARTSR